MAEHVPSVSEALSVILSTAGALRSTERSPATPLRMALSLLWPLGTTGSGSSGWKQIRAALTVSPHTSAHRAVGSDLLPGEVRAL